MKKIFVCVSLALMTTAGAGCAVQLEPEGRSAMPRGEILPRATKSKALAHFAKGNEYAREGRFKKAVRRYTKAIDADPKYRDAYVNRAIAYMEIVRFDKALPDFAEALEIGPEDAGIYYNLGNAYAIQAQWSMAVTCYEKSLELDPDHEGALNNLGNAFGSLGRVDDAIATFRAYSERFPDKAVGHNNLGVALEMSSQAGDAERAYRAALQAEPDSPEAYLNLGRIHRKRGDACGAIRMLVEYTRRIGDRDPVSRQQVEGSIGTLLADCPSGANLLNDLPEAN